MAAHSPVASRVRVRSARPAFSTALRVAGSSVVSRTHCASAVTRPSMGPVVPSQNASTAGASALPARSSTRRSRHQTASAAWRSSMMRKNAPCALARMTVGGVSSVRSKSSSGKAARRAASAQLPKVITGTPGTSSEGSTRET